MKFKAALFQLRPLAHGTHQIISVIISWVHLGGIAHHCDGQGHCFSAAAATVLPAAPVHEPFRLQSPRVRFVEKSDGGTPRRIMRVE